MHVTVSSPLAGSVWKLAVHEGDVVAVGDTLIVLESMKMEIPVEAETAGKVVEIKCLEGSAVSEGEPLIVLSVTSA